MVILAWLFRQVNFSLSKLLSIPYDSFAFIKSTFPVDVSILVGMLARVSFAYRLVSSIDP
jgi:hypothetical protein